MSKIPDNVITQDSMNLRSMCNVAYANAMRFIDKYSGYGVGVVLEVRYGYNSQEYTETYTAHNIRLSGIQFAMHAEQLAGFNALMDISKLSDATDATLERIVVVTTGDDVAVNCGHCMQVLKSICGYTETDSSKFTIIGADRSEEDEETNPIWNIQRATLDEFMGDTYVENRDRS